MILSMWYRTWRRGSALAMDNDGNAFVATEQNIIVKLSPTDIETVDSIGSIIVGQENRKWGHFES